MPLPNTLLTLSQDCAETTKAHFSLAKWRRKTDFKLFGIQRYMIPNPVHIYSKLRKQWQVCQNFSELISTSLV